MEEVSRFTDRTVKTLEGDKKRETWSVVEFESRTDISNSRQEGGRKFEKLRDSKFQIPERREVGEIVKLHA